MRKENKSDIIQNALNYLDDELVFEAGEIREKSINMMIEQSSLLKRDRKQTQNKKKKVSWHHITTLVASVAIFFIAGFVWNEVISPSGESDFQEECAMEDEAEGDTLKDYTTDEVEELKNDAITDEVVQE